MIIGVDGNEANVSHKVGVSVYTANLLEYFKTHATKDLRFIVYLRDKPSEQLPSSSEFFSYKVVWGPKMWSQLFLPLALWKQKIMGEKLHVFFSPAHYIPRFSPFKTVVTIHDLSYLYFPHEFLKKDLYQLNNWTRYSLQNSSHIIAVSKTTKKDIMHEYAIEDKKISVVYNGYNLPKKVPMKQHNKNLSPYFLYVGTIQPRKNLETLIEAFSTLHSTHPEFKLIMAGKKGWLYDAIFKQVEKLNLKEYIHFLGYVTDEEKNNLYAEATALVLPSLYEGFGIPLLEAMALGCPVISSFSSSLPEVGGEACLYFDPKNGTDLVEKMSLLITDKDLRINLIATGKQRAQLFSWRQSGEQTLTILMKIPL